MGIIQLPTPLVGQGGLLPASKLMVTTDSLAALTTAGYLNSVNLEGYPVGQNDILQVLYNYNLVLKTGVYEIFIASITNGVITLVQWSNPGDVLLPVVSGNFAIFNGTTGQVFDAGYAPSNASDPFVVMSAGSFTTNHVAQLADANGSIKDGGVLGTAASKAASDNSKSTLASLSGAVTINHIASFSDTAGTITDSGIATSTVQNKTNIVADRADVGGQGQSVTITVAGVTPSSIIVANVAVSTVPVSIQKVTPATGDFVVLMSADPTTACLIDYVVFIAPQ